MKKYLLLLLSLLLSFFVQSQDYKIDFSASGVSNTLDSVHVINLDQQTEATVPGTDTLHLFKSGVGIETMQFFSLGIKFFPNPLQEGKGTLSFYLATSGQTRIEIFDIEGKKLLSENIFLQSGKNDFHCSGMPSGFFMVNVTSNSYSESVKLISINGQRGIPRLEFVQSTSSKTQKTAIKSSKSVKSIIGMQYNDGEQLKFTAYSDNLTSVDTIIPNQTQTLNFNFVIGQYPSGTVHCISGGAAVVDVTNPATGKTWMDRNLGASQQATSSTHSQAYGDLYQWGRFSDGHQCRGSDTKSATSATDNPAHGDYITSNSDWRSPQNDNLWQGVYGLNNPCPNGYRLPNQTELNNEHLSWSSHDSAGAYASPLKLSLAGYRYRLNGLLSSVSSIGFYWSSSIDGIRVRRLYISSSDAIMFSYYRAAGGSVRCIKD